MSNIRRIAFIGNSLPRRCGIATFTTDLQQAVAASSTDCFTSIVAMTDGSSTYDYPPSVGCVVKQERLADYVNAAAYINSGRFDAVSLQHEFGIFGGDAGDYILALLEKLTVPFTVTLHTVLSAPTPAQRRVLERITATAARIIVMAEKARNILVDGHGVNPATIEVIPHGIPDFPFVEPDRAKESLGFANRTVILTFGLLSPNKGIEVMIDAMPTVLATQPDATYVVLGATHPNLVREQGESHRQSLVARAKELGVGDNVIFNDQFVDRSTLLEYISMCDIYVTPYLNVAQMTSGTLAYSFGLGKAVVSTPYWHAIELLADGRGSLVPFGDAAATGSAIAALLKNDPLRQAMRRRAYGDSRSMIWERTAERYIEVFGRVRATELAATRVLPIGLREFRPTPAIALDHLLAMTDDTGLCQHAIHSVPDRAHGYCVDDNARALLLAMSLKSLGDQQLSERVTFVYAAFVQHAFNHETKRFRNFMSFDRQWLEPQGSEDSHGRTLWSLGSVLANDTCDSRRRWSAALFVEALPVVEDFRSPRSWVFTLLGLDAYCSVIPSDDLVAALRLRLADRLLRLLAQVETPDWIWFEENLAYDNARFCEALILTGKGTGVEDYRNAGLRTLGWLIGRQKSPTGLFRPVGTESFHSVRASRGIFDQQPVEAAATIAACCAARRVTDEPRWMAEAQRAFSWFLGSNDLSQPLVDPETGSCRDGLHPDRRNENRGAESALSYLLGLTDIRMAERRTRLPSKISGQEAALCPKSVISHSRGRIAALNLP